jgi:hypothetical protein
MRGGLAVPQNEVCLGPDSTQGAPQIVAGAENEAAYVKLAGGT